jgi:hypothetical protein
VRPESVVVQGFATTPGRAVGANVAVVAAGGIALAVVMLLVLPVAAMLGGAIWSALLGFLLVEDTDVAAD